MEPNTRHGARGRELNACGRSHLHALALFFLHYNFVRIHKTLKVTPAMAAGVSAKLWTMEEIAEEIEARRPAPGKRGPYKKRVSA